MEIKDKNGIISINKQLNSLDKFVIKFSDVLNKMDVKYVFVSGYVSIIFGRNRSSEDIDILVEKLDFQKFCALWDRIIKDFDCIITGNKKEAYDEYLSNNHAIRFSEKGKFVPNMEVKFPKTELDFWSLNNSIKVSLNGSSLFLSKIELQIPFKLFLGSEKDLEDAKFLYELFKDNIDINLLNAFNEKLKTTKIFNKICKK